MRQASPTHPSMRRKAEREGGQRENGKGKREKGRNRGKRKENPSGPCGVIIDACFRSSSIESVERGKRVKILIVTRLQDGGTCTVQARYKHDTSTEQEDNDHLGCISLPWIFLDHVGKTMTQGEVSTATRQLRVTYPPVPPPLRGASIRPPLQVSGSSIRLKDQAQATNRTSPVWTKHFDPKGCLWYLNQKPGISASPTPWPGGFRHLELGRIADRGGQNPPVSVIRNNNGSENPSGMGVGIGRIRITEQDSFVHGSLRFVSTCPDHCGFQCDWF